MLKAWPLVFFGVGFLAFAAMLTTWRIVLETTPTESGYVEVACGSLFNHASSAVDDSGVHDTGTICSDARRRRAHQIGILAIGGVLLTGLGIGSIVVMHKPKEALLV